MASRWAIVGAGVLGMTLALRLARQGKQVTLIEGAATLGGLASAWQLGDLVWDRHYHVTLLSDAHLRALLAELDLERDLEWKRTRTGVYAGGRLYSVSSTLDLLRFPVLGWWDVLRLGATVLRASRIRDWRQLEQLTVSEWLVRWSGTRTYERFWLPLLRSKLGEAYADTSATFIWASIQRLYAARRSGMKREMFGTVRGGYARVLERLASRLDAAGVRTQLGTRVARVSPAHGLLQVEFDGSAAAAFDHVVVTAPAPVAARLCAGLPAEEADRLAGVRYLGIVCASALLRRPLEGYYVTNLLDPGFPFTGVIEMSALVRPEHFAGRGLVYLPRYVAPGDPFADLSDPEVRLRFLQGLQRVYPSVQEDDVLDFRISRVQYVMPLPTLGYSLRLPAVDSAVRGLHFVNSAQILNGTLNVNETVQLAERAAAGFAAMP